MLRYAVHEELMKVLASIPLLLIKFMGCFSYINYSHMTRGFPLKYFLNIYSCP